VQELCQFCVRAIDDSLAKFAYLLDEYLFVHPYDSYNLLKIEGDSQFLGPLLHSWDPKLFRLLLCQQQAPLAGSDCHSLGMAESFLLEELVYK
jgi:hypothetical protein